MWYLNEKRMSDDIKCQFRCQETCQTTRHVTVRMRTCSVGISEYMPDNHVRPHRMKTSENQSHWKSQEMLRWVSDDMAARISVRWICQKNGQMTMVYTLESTGATYQRTEYMSGEYQNPCHMKMSNKTGYQTVRTHFRSIKVANQLHGQGQMTSQNRSQCIQVKWSQYRSDQFSEFVTKASGRQGWVWV